MNLSITKAELSKLLSHALSETTFKRPVKVITTTFALTGNADPGWISFSVNDDEPSANQADELDLKKAT